MAKSNFSASADARESAFGFHPVFITIPIGLPEAHAGALTRDRACEAPFAA